MSSVTLRPLAQIDIEEIWDYIADDSELQADAVIDRLGRQFTLLAARPKMGRARSELRRGLRSFPCGHYVIFYSPVADGIRIERVLHGARDVEGAMRAKD